MEMITENFDRQSQGIQRPAPVLNWRGRRPSQAPKSRPRSNAWPVPIAATIAVEISGPTPERSSGPASSPPSG